MPGAIDHAHAAFAEFPEDLVTGDRWRGAGLLFRIVLMALLGGGGGRVHRPRPHGRRIDGVRNARGVIGLDHRPLPLMFWLSYTLRLQLLGLALACTACSSGGFHARTRLPHYVDHLW